PAARVELARRRDADPCHRLVSGDRRRHDRATAVSAGFAERQHRGQDHRCVIETACVSSKSSPCARAPLASAASGGGAVRLEPTTLQAPLPQPFTAPRTEGARSEVEEASAMPRMSRVRRRTLATTSVGISSNSRRAANSVRRSASVMRPESSLAGQRDVAVGLAEVSVGLPAPDRGHAAALAVLDLEFFGEPGADHLLYERLPAGAD